MLNYFDKYKELADQYLAINLKRLIDREEKIGTDCLLFKWKDNPYSEAMGTGSNILDVDNPIKFRMIFNKNYFFNPHNTQLDNIMTYTAHPAVKQGDVIEFRTRDETYRFKVELLEEYSIDSRILKRLTLSGYRNSG